MAKYCLRKDLALEFKKALKSKKLDPERLANMTSDDRRALFTEVSGPENAANINSLFERTILRKYKYEAYIKWAKEVTGIKEPVRRDLVHKIEKMNEGYVDFGRLKTMYEDVLGMKSGNKSADTMIKELEDAGVSETEFRNNKIFNNLLDPLNEKEFLNDLVNTKLGMTVSLEEAQKISQLTKKLTEVKANYSGFGDSVDKNYGSAQRALERYIIDVKKKGVSQIPNDAMGWIEAIASNSKATTAAMDNSFGGRQGIKVLYTHPIKWSKSFLKSFVDLAKGFKNGSDDVIDGILAEIYNREHSINGNYRKFKIDLGGTEEAFPGTWAEKIPIFKRLFQASEAAYNGMALRLRADMADLYLKKAIEGGVNLDEIIEPGKISRFIKRNPEKISNGESIGRFVNSLTGRGHIGALEKNAKLVNAVFFSPKFVKSNIDAFISPITGTGGSNFVRKEAAKNLLKMVGSISGILAVADFLHPGSVEKDPRSTNFGKIKIGDTRFDITGGMIGLVTLAMRLMPTLHNGEWGQWVKSGTTGEYTKLGEGFGAKKGSDVFFDFTLGKLSPPAGIIRDLLKGETMQGDPITALGILKQSTVPIIGQNYMDLMKSPNHANAFIVMLADALGISTSTYSISADWNNNTGKEINAFKDSVGQEKFDEANNEYNQMLSNRFIELSNDKRYQGLSEKDKKKVLTNMKKSFKEKIFEKYNFSYDDVKEPPAEPSKVVEELSV